MDHPQRVIDTDAAMLSKAASTGERFGRLWQLPKCLVAAARERTLPGHVRASQRSAERGWPVLYRRTGGLAVPQGPGVLNVSLCWSMPQCSSSAGYELLGTVVGDAMATMDVTTRLGAVVGALCPGAADIVAGGRKMGGTAQRWGIARTEGRCALAHANLFVDLDTLEANDAVNAYYRDLALPHRFRASALVTMRELIVDVTPDRIGSALAAALAARGFCNFDTSIARAAEEEIVDV